MRTIEWTSQFKRDFKRESRGRHQTALTAEFVSVIDSLSNDVDLDPRHHDHPLTGDWKDHRDCHIKPDLVLVYRMPDAQRLQLVRLGSHSELGL